MRPDERELDDEIRGHLALAIQERIERGEDPEAARRAALREFGYVPRGPRLDAPRLVQPLVRRGDATSRRTCASACARCCAPRASRPPSSSRSRSASAPTPRSSASSAACCCARSSIAARSGWSTSARARPGIGADEHDVLGARDRRLQVARHHDRARSATSRPSTSRWSASASRASCRPASSAARSST